MTVLFNAHRFKRPSSASFISPRVHSLLQTDPTSDTFFSEFLTKTVPEKRVFHLLEQLMKGIPIDPLDSDGEALLEIAAFLDNRELLEQLIQDESPIDQSLSEF
jgi:hypothetical protein